MINYHEYGVNVKVYDAPPKVEGQEILSEEDLYSAWEMAIVTFWEALSDHTKQFYNKDCWSEGRMGGWAVFDTGDYEPPEKWVEEVNSMVLWAKNDVYPEIVENMIEDKRYESYMIVVLPDGETFDILDNATRFGYVETDKLDKLDYSLQIDNKIQSGDVDFVLDGEDVKSLSRIKAR